MAIYVGILSNRGKVLESDEEAVIYAFEACGIEPTEDWLLVDAEFCSMLLEWFYSGDWVVSDEEDRVLDNPYFFVY